MPLYEALLADCGQVLGPDHPDTWRRGTTSRPPDTIQRRFLETPGQIITTGDTITIRLERCAYSPVLRKASLPADTRVPWLGNRTIRCEYA